VEEFDQVEVDYILTLDEGALVQECLADYKAGRLFTQEQIQELLAEISLTQDDESKVAEAEELVKLGLIHTHEGVMLGLKEIREEWICKNPRGSQP
jgi:hypothetical protein